MYKKITACITAFAFIFASAYISPESVSDISVVTVSAAEGTCGSAVNWSYNSGTLTISGTGEMKNYASYVAPWNEQKLSVKSVIIEDGVTAIGTGAFYKCTDLQSVQIPSSVKIIGEAAFGFCTSLSSVTIPESVEKLGYRSFMNCNSLNSFEIPANVSSIGDSVLSYCSNLKTISVAGGNKDFCVEDNVLFTSDKSRLICYPVTKSDSSYKIPDTVKEIGNSAFAYNANIRNVTFPASLEKINDKAFYKSGISFLELGNSVSFMGEEAFAYCENLAGANLSDSIPDVKKNAFAECKNLNQVKLPANLKTIGMGSFSECNSLVKIVVPSSVTIIDYSAFQACKKLESITIRNANCDIADSGSTISNAEENTFVFNGTIYGYSGSTAEKYARTYGYNFAVTNESPDAPITTDPVVTTSETTKHTTVTTVTTTEYTTTATTETTTVPTETTTEYTTTEYTTTATTETTTKYTTTETTEYTTTTTPKETTSEHTTITQQTTINNTNQKGDANSDGNITSEDALAILQMVVGLNYSINWGLAEVTGDWQVTAEDALLILQYVVGSISEL